MIRDIAWGVYSIAGYIRYTPPAMLYPCYAVLYSCYTTIGVALGVVTNIALGIALYIKQGAILCT